MKHKDLGHEAQKFLDLVWTPWLGLSLRRIFLAGFKNGSEIFQLLHGKFGHLVNDDRESLYRWTVSEQAQASPAIIRQTTNYIARKLVAKLINNLPLHPYSQVLIEGLKMRLGENYELVGVNFQWRASG